MKISSKQTKPRATDNTVNEYSQFKVIEVKAGEHEGRWVGSGGRYRHPWLRRRREGSLANAENQQWHLRHLPRIEIHKCEKNTFCILTTMQRTVNVSWVMRWHTLKQSPDSLNICQTLQRVHWICISFLSHQFGHANWPLTHSILPSSYLLIHQVWAETVTKTSASWIKVVVF